MGHEQILLKGGRALLSNPFRLEETDILVRDGQIVSVDRNLSVSADASTVDVKGHLILPGFVNAHTHANNNLVKGSVDRWTLEGLRNRAAVLYSNRTPRDHYVSAAIGAIEMVKTGCTTAYDQFAAVPALVDDSVDAVVQAYTDVGMRGLLAPAVVDRVFQQTLPGMTELLPKELATAVAKLESAPTDELLRLTHRAVDRWNDTADGRIRMATAPTIPGECTDSLLVGCKQISDEYGVGLHVHLAESKIQAVTALHATGKTIVERLQELNILGPDFVGAHGVWLSEVDISTIVDAGGMIAHNPASNLRVGSGIAPIRELLAAGVPVGLGTDGSVASDNQNMFEAMRFAGLLGNVRFPYRTEQWLRSTEILEMATTGGARLVGLSDSIGVIESGRRGDLVFVRDRSPFLRPLNDVLNALIYCETGADVEAVMVDGRFIMQGGKLLTVDEDKLYAEAEEAAHRLRVQNRPEQDLAEALDPFVTQACLQMVATTIGPNRYAVEPDKSGLVPAAQVMTETRRTPEV